MVKNMKILNQFKIIRANGYEDFSQIALRETLRLTKGSKQKLLLLPTGNSPTGFYREFTHYLNKNTNEKKRFFLFFKYTILYYSNRTYGKKYENS